jgi:hypothetical protein
LGPDTLAQRDTGRFSFYGQTDKPERVGYVVNWNDQSYDTGPAIRSGDTVGLAHAWADTGLFDVLCRAMDENGRLSDWSAPKPVYIINLPPFAPGQVAGPDTLSPDEAGEFSAVTTDPEGDIIAYEFDWDDGSSQEAPGYASGSTARVLHDWHDSGTFAVKVRASDEARHRSDWSPAHPLVVTP